MKLPLILLSVLSSAPVVAAGSPKFKLSGNPSCSSGKLSFDITTTCSDDCGSGDKVVVSGTAKATGEFDSDAKVTLQPCVTGPMGMMNFYCPSEYEQDMGTICDWISSSTVSCGSAASDYVVSKEIEIPKEVERFQSSSFTNIRIKALIGGSETCEASASGYQMSSSSSASLVTLSVIGSIALMGGAYFIRRKNRRVTTMEDGQTQFIEMSDSATQV